MTAAHDFFAELFPPLDVGEYIEIRAKAHDGTVTQRFCVSIADTEREAQSLASSHDTWFGVGTRDGHGGRKENIVRIGAAFADVDFKHFPDGEAGARAAIEGFPLKPSVVVDSGGGYQPFWLLREPVEREEFGRLEAVNRGLTFALAPHGKRLDAAIDVSRVLRVPDTVNYKYDPPRPVRVVGWHPERRYNLSELEEWLPEVPIASGNGGQADADIANLAAIDSEAALYKALPRLGRGEAGRLLGMLHDPEAYAQRFPSQSELDFAVVCTLLRAGLADAEVAAVWRGSELGQRAKAQRRDDYIARTIASARASVSQKTPEKFSSNYREGSLELNFVREVNAAELQVRGRETGDNYLSFLPVMGQDGYLVKGWSHIVAGYPKSGKTELLVRLVAHWPAEQVLYITEEPQGVWAARLARLPDSFGHVTILFGLGMTPDEILTRIQSGTEAVVVLDTVRNLLGLRDETDNSEIARACIPYIAACRPVGKTPILVHHDRKGGGEYGEGIAGGHAFLGVVDIALELLRDRQAPRRRLLRGWGRVVEVPELMYELAEDGTLKALGAPSEVAIADVIERCKAQLSEEWQTTQQVTEGLGDPRPSVEQVRQALVSLANSGEAERDPPIADGQARGKAHRWRRGFVESSVPTKVPIVGTELPRASAGIGASSASPNGHLVEAALAMGARPINTA